MRQSGTETTDTVRPNPSFTLPLVCRYPGKDEESEGVAVDTTYEVGFVTVSLGPVGTTTVTGVVSRRLPVPDRRSLATSLTSNSPVLIPREEP